MSVNFLEFEKPIAELEAKIEELRLVNQGGEFDLNIEEEITKLRARRPTSSSPCQPRVPKWCGRCPGEAAMPHLLSQAITSS
jgi:acetyl-CoA carboxylase carboxyl transferase subunit alpha